MLIALVLSMNRNHDSGGLPSASTFERTEYVTRAPRFPIQAPLQYREGGEQSWHKGTTINISRTGVLFSAEQALNLQTVLEMRIAFPPELTGDAETNVVCWGPVVRAQMPRDEGQSHTLAASIFRYRFKSS